MDNKKPTILVIVGITGDLSTRKLLPAISEILEADVLSDEFTILGVTRQQGVDKETILRKVTNSEKISKYLELFSMMLDDVEEYKKLSIKLKDIESRFSDKADRLFYLSVPPEASLPIIEFLGKSGISDEDNTKLLLEKPFGVDLPSAHKMVKDIDKYFKAEQAYRIDHYLAKEVTQNIIVFREKNSLFRHTWNNNFIERIEIVASEEIGIEGRGLFYEQTGALRDVVQSHLLQLLAITLMDISGLDDQVDVPSRRLAALKYVKIDDDKPIDRSVIRGQYKGYKDEVNNSESSVETFISIDLVSTSPRWQGVPIRIIAGKKLDRKVTEIKIYYKKDSDSESNELILRIQPDESIVVRLWSNTPGYENKIEKHMLDFKYSDYYNKLPEAYERVILDASRSNHDLFTSSEEVLESWRIVAPIQEAVDKGMCEIKIYEGGSKPVDIL